MACNFRPDQVVLNLKVCGVPEEPGELHRRGETTGRGQHDHVCRGEETVQWKASLESHKNWAERCSSPDTKRSSWT